MRTAVVTVVRGRHSHLRRQHEHLSRMATMPDHVVVVAMGDGAVRDVVADGPLAGSADVLAMPASRRLPLARARNLGAQRALERGAELVVLLDVDCLPAPGLLTAYAVAARSVDPAVPSVLCGPVRYLPPPADDQDYRDDEVDFRPAHPVRPDPPDDAVEQADDLRLFWSLSFAVTAASWTRIGGFDEAYTGYGGEDTDFAQRAARVGATMWWVGGARAAHQWHPVSDPPTEHLHDVVRNANLFHDRWGWFPMEGWLAAFERQGLARVEAGRWRVADPARVSARS